MFFVYLYHFFTKINKFACQRAFENLEFVMLFNKLIIWYNYRPTWLPFRYHCVRYMLYFHFTWQSSILIIVSKVAWWISALVCDRKSAVVVNLKVLAMTYDDRPSFSFIKYCTMYLNVSWLFASVLTEVFRKLLGCGLRASSRQLLCVSYGGAIVTSRLHLLFVCYLFCHLCTIDNDNDTTIIQNTNKAQ